MELVQEPGSKRVSALLRPRCGLLGRHPKRAALSGGRGKVFGAVVGTIIFAVIANLLSLLNVSTFLQDAFRGALILVAVTLATVHFVRKRKTDTAEPAAK